MAGLIGKAAVFAGSPPGSLGGTFAGNPVACAAALAVFDVIEREGLLARAEVIGSRLLARLEVLKSRPDVRPIGHVRGLGAMVAFEMVTERGGNSPDAEAAKRLASRACELGLLMLPCGFWANTIRVSVPLTCPDVVLDEGLARLEQALAV